MKLRLPQCGFTLFGLLASPPAHAQITPPNFTCTANPGVVPAVRAEGLTELIGDIVINCTGGGPTPPPGSPLPKVNITLGLNTTVTSRLIRSPLTEALLLIDEPPPDKQFVAGASPGNVAGCVPSPECPNVFAGRLIDPNSLLWLGVPVDPPGPQAQRVFRLTNIRGNAAQLSAAFPDNANPPQLEAFVEIASADPALVFEPQRFSTVRQVLPTFSFRAEDTTSISSSAGHTGRVATLRFRENFASAFKTANCAVTPANPNPSRQDLFRAGTCVTNVLWPYVSAQAGFETGLAISNTSQDPFGPSPNPFPGYFGLGQVGIPRGGTELQATFKNIPTGMRIFVNATNQIATTDSYARLLQTPDSQQFAPVQPNGFTPMLTVCPDYQTTGTCTVAWEVVGANPDRIQDFAFTVDGILPPGTQITQTTVTRVTPALGPSAAAWNIKEDQKVTPGFQGYLIGQANFRFAHGFGFIDDLGARRLAMGYLALILDDPVARPEAERDHAAWEVRTESLGNLREESRWDPVALTQDRAILLGEQKQQTAPRRFELTSEGYLPKTIRLGAAGSSRLSAFAISVQTSPPPAQTGGVPWLHVEQVGEATPVTLIVTVDPKGLQPGTYQGSVTAQPMTPAGAAPGIIPFELVVPPPGPRVRTFGVTSAGSYAHSVVAPGEAVVVFGVGFGPPALAGLVLRDGVVATQIGETRILFDGEPAPMIYSVANQASCFVPFSVEGKQFVQMIVEYQGVPSPPVRLAVLPAKPALLTADQSGGGVGAILNQDNSFNFQKAARAGEIIQIFGIGGGQTAPPSVGGRLQTGAAVYKLPIRAFVDGVEVVPVYAGPAPNLVEGVFQVNLILPANVRSGHLQLSIFFGDDLHTQPGATVRVE